MRSRCCLLLTALLLATACTQDAYDKGEGPYSLMRADLVEALVATDSLVTAITTDEDQQLLLTNPRRLAGTKQVDTLYRALAYYNLSGDNQAELLSLSRISTPLPMPKDSLKEGMKTDPVGLESMWMSHNGRFLNVSLYLKTGQTEDKEAVHHLAIVSDTLVAHADSLRTLCLLLYHDQGGMPEYYSQRTYFSIPMQGLTADTVQLTVTTYDGTIVRRFPTKRN